MSNLIDLGVPPPSEAHVISYTRFSTKRQEDGHSKERQDDAARKWCLAEGYELDFKASIHDPGYSAYSAAHLKNGGLGVLQRAAMDGKLHNTVLLIEAFDRLTRMELRLAYELLLSLVNNGVVVVTLTDDRVWSKKTLNNFEAFMLSLLTLYRGHQESARKSEMIRKKFAAARAQETKSAFGSAPGWLKRKSKNSPWEVDEERAEVVRKVFRMSADGYGAKAISKRAIAEGWPVPTRDTSISGRWHSRTAGIILRNEAVLGIHEHRIMTYEAKEKDWKGVSSGVRRLEYYPRIVSDELWTAAKASIETRRKDKRRDTHYYNIFTSLMYCGHCGAPMHRRTETRGYSRATVACADKISGATVCPSGSAVTLDAPILEAIFSHAPQSATDNDTDIRITECEEKIRIKENELKNLAEAIAKQGAKPWYLETENALEFELTTLCTQRDTLLVMQYLESNAELPDEFLEEVISKLYVPDLEARDYRAALHLKIARLVETIWVWNYEVAIVEFKHSNTRVIVPLDYKRLPSRANTLAKWHRPPPPKEPPPRPFLESARNDTITIPKPRKIATKLSPRQTTTMNTPSPSELPRKLPFPL